jgi:hypothetical protein
VAKPKLPWMKMALYLPFALVNIAGGLFFVWMPFLFPIGILLLVAGAMPYVRWISKKIHADIEYANRDRPLLEDDEVPWFETEETAGLTDDQLINIMLNQTGRGSND